MAKRTPKHRSNRYGFHNLALDLTYLRRNWRPIFWPKIKRELRDAWHTWRTH